MTKLTALLFTLLLTLSCEERSAPNFDSNEVSLLLLDEKGRNLFDPKSPSTLSLNDIRVYYIDNKGQRILQNHTAQDKQHLAIDTFKETASAILKVRINMDDANQEFAKTLINIHPYGEIDISATTQMLPLSSPLGAGGSIVYENLHVNAVRIASNNNYKPVQLQLKRD